MALCLHFLAVPVVGFEEAVYTIVENDTVISVFEVCVALIPPPALARTLTVTMRSVDVSASGEHQRRVYTDNQSFRSRFPITKI